MKNSSDTIGNRTLNLPACSTVRQPTAPPRASFDIRQIVNNVCESFYETLLFCFVWLLATYLLIKGICKVTSAERSASLLYVETHTVSLKCLNAFRNI